VSRTAPPPSRKKVAGFFIGTSQKPNGTGIILAAFAITPVWQLAVVGLSGLVIVLIVWNSNRRGSPKL
jgi:hypothetical protein